MAILQFFQVDKFLLIIFNNFIGIQVSMKNKLSGLTSNSGG